MESELTVSHKVTIALLPCNSCPCKTLRVVEKNAAGKIISSRGSVRITECTHLPGDLGLSRVIHFTRPHGKGGVLSMSTVKSSEVYATAYANVLKHFKHLGYEQS
jgi:hypothetical protein